MCIQWIDFVSRDCESYLGSTKNIFKFFSKASSDYRSCVNLLQHFSPCRTQIVEFGLLKRSVNFLQCISDSTLMILIWLARSSIKSATQLTKPFRQLSSLEIVAN